MIQGEKVHLHIVHSQEFSQEENSISGERHFKPGWIYPHLATVANKGLRWDSRSPTNSKVYIYIPIGFMGLVYSPTNLYTHSAKGLCNKSLKFKIYSLLLNM